MPQSSNGTRETILVVDNNALILSAVAEVLKSAGFDVLLALCGSEAVKLDAATTREIHLLLSGVDMPEMSGPDLGQVLKQVRPALRVMFMSGGIQGNLLVLNYGWDYIEKRSIAVKLVRRIREVLATPDRSQPGGQSFDSRKEPGPPPGEQYSTQLRAGGTPVLAACDSAPPSQRVVIPAASETEALPAVQTLTRTVAGGR
jgi:DNA-binding response OmpR family regulator